MKNQILKISILLMLFILTNYKYVFLIILVIYFTKSCNKKGILFLTVFLYVLVYLNYYPYTKSLNGIVRKINSTYLVVNNTIVYCDTSGINLYDKVLIDEEVTLIEETISSFAFSYSNYYRSLNVIYKTNSKNIVIVERSNSPISLLYKKIVKIENLELRNFYLQIILNIKSKDASKFILYNGFLFSGIFFWLHFILKWFFDNSTINKVNLFFSFLLLIFYNFPFVLIRLTLKKTLLFSKFTKFDQLGILIIILLIINPYNLYTIAFIFPIAFYFVAVFYSKNIFAFHFTSIIVQASNFYSVQILKVILFKYIIRFMALIYFLSIIFLLINPDLGYLLIAFMKLFDTLNNSYSIYGNLNLINVGLMSVCFILVKKNNYRFLILGTLLLLLNYTNLSHPFTKISYLNVKQGDATLIKLNYNKGVILIDTGKESSYQYLDSYLKANGIKVIDYLVITHDDEDHNGNLENLKKDYHVKNIVLSKMDIKLNKLELYNLNFGKYDNDNDNSLIYYFKLNGLTYFFGGDISKEVENELIDRYPNIKVDVLKLSHHGSKTSSDSYFIKNINPQIAMISAGNTYGHPSKETISNLNNFKIPYFLTKEDGDIEIYATFFNNIIYTTTNNFVIIDK